MVSEYVDESVNDNAINRSESDELSNKASLAWANFCLTLLRETPNGSPTYGSRFVGYVGLTMYESVAPGSNSYSSIAGQLNGLGELPKPKKKSKINWTLALNAGQARIVKHLYGFAFTNNIVRIDSLESKIRDEFVPVLSEKEVAISESFGREIADAIFEWSKTDGGHGSYMKGYDSTFAWADGPGLWNPPAKGQSPIPLPLHHNWGNNRTFALANQLMPIPEMIPYDYKVGSDYYNQMKAVYDTRLNLTQEEKEIANWWGDDPAETFSPPGHSYYFASIAVKETNADIFKAAQTYAAVGMSVADAFVNCFRTKYHYNAGRPFAFIYHNISTLWELYWPEPPFPAFYSGHAVQASSAATVLTSLYGEDFEFTDMSHVGRPDDTERLVEYKARHFKSFNEAAEESANSRLFGGIHTPQDNEVGLIEGKEIGKNINNLFL
ncbi:phosphoesterase [Arcticibacterium luteifluviistationis]|uniref:Phosphoesterase n=2 Tax=Arcticibacterium luteifluviistationis TaxID=1784714 RepID=A0A2Z4GIM5_9BACT|nr:phosphoesterase [Arcticibacterium luteifluviistationis]